MKIYVGNMSYQTTEDGLRELFGQHGEVSEVTIIMDRDTGRPKGFGFVEMRDDASARKAITELDGREIDGRTLKVNEAKPRENRGGGSWGGGGGGGGRGRGGGFGGGRRGF